MADDQPKGKDAKKFDGDAGAGDKTSGPNKPAGKGNANPPWQKLEKTPPKEWPPYKDPEGRKISPVHNRRARRGLATLGIEAENNNHALHLAAHYGIDFFSKRVSSMLDSLPAIQKKANEVEVSKTGTEVALLQDPDEHNIITKQEPKANRKAKPITTEDREAEVAKIQRDLIRRRRKRLRALLLRLFVFVVLPTLVVGYYFNAIATPMYETESQFVIQTSENPAAGGGLGGLLAGTGFATSQDSIVVQGFLGSREAFLRLNREFDYVNHFKDPNIDVVQRLRADANLDEAYAYFRKRVTIGYDPTEGIIRMAVVAATPQASQRFAEALVGYAEQRVDGLTQEARGDQLVIAEERYNEAEAAMLAAEQRVLELQQQRGVLSADVELSSQMSIINSLELQKEQKRLELAELMENPRPNESRADLQRNEITRLEARIKELRNDLTQNSDSTVSLARISGELRIAETNLATRHLILQESISAMETSRLEANRQVRYLSLGVAPVAPVEATYPRKVESTILAGFIFMGMYIMASLTLSILREQISV